MNILQQIKLDWQEFWDDQYMRWLKRRDYRNIQRTIRNAKMNHLLDGRTYYIMRDPNGNPHAVRWKDVKGLPMFKGKTHVDAKNASLCYVNANGVHWVLEKPRLKLWQAIQQGKVKV